MLKELTICVLVIFFVIVGNTLTQNYTKKCLAEMDFKLTTLKEEIQKSDKNEKKINNDIKGIKSRWDEMQEILAFYIEHDELEKVGTQLFLLEGEIEANIYDDAIPEIEKCIFIIEHIKDKNAFDAKNIF